MWFCGVGALFAAMAATAGAQAPTGTIAGQVLDAGSQQPIPEVVVRVSPAERVARTDEHGRFRLINVPAGPQRVLTSRLGYQPSSRPVTVEAGGSIEVDVTLQAASAVLQQIVTVATSAPAEQARVNGSQIGIITVDSVPLGPVTSFSDLLNSRVPGLVVEMNSGEVGSGAQIIARGQSSALLSNEPLIVIDGIRAYNNTNGLGDVGGVGGQTISRFDDFDFENIEDVQVLRGPAAAALYGTEAAAGVIVITTRKGDVAESPRWHFHGNLGRYNDVTDYPANYGRPSDSAGASIVGPNGCSLIYEYAGYCVGANGPLGATTPISYKLVGDSGLLKQGYDEGVGLSLEGGTQMATYYTGVDWDRQQGVLADNSDRFTHTNGSFTLHPSSKIDLGLTALYTQRRTVLPLGDNAVGGPLTGAMLGGPGPGEYLYDGFPLSPSLTEQINYNEDVDRYTIGGTGSARILPWLTARGNAGVDYIGLFDHYYLPSYAQQLNTTPADAVDNAIYEYTGAASISAKYSLTRSLKGTTTFGGEWVDYSLHNVSGGGQSLTPGTGSVNGATAGFTASEANEEIVNIGGYLQEQIAWRDVLFVTGSGRIDGNSAFGVSQSSTFYPSGNVSYVLSDEAFFPRQPYVSLLRLRFAAGQSGREPTFRLAEASYQGLSYNYQGAGNTVGVGPFTTGNPELKPEKSTEFEAGFDAGFWRDRFTLAATVYDRDEKDLIENVPIDISTGFSSITTNLGDVDNRGLELTFNGVIFKSDPVTFSLGTTLDVNRNKLNNIGPLQSSIVANGVQNVVQENLEGEPLGVYVSVPYTYKDLNHDGVITPSDITYGKNPVVVGEPGPREELTITPTITVYKYFRINAQFDRRDGVTVYDFADEFRCTSFQNGPECNDPKAPASEQAAAVAANFGGTDYGYLLNGSFWKVRELSLAMIMPDAWARYLLGGRGASLTIAARNVATWTPYRGLDPEVNEFGGQVTLQRAQFFTQPPLRALEARVDITW
jgi:TonB-linked SusC/RagA family outer membrane protein